jgi:organic radical activating enzyme
MKTTTMTNINKKIINIVDESSDRSYYCSMKFRYLKIDLESLTTYNCHAATPHSIDFFRLEENPGQLFNTPINVEERKQMLVNQRNKSCEQNCWPAEDVGAVSPRLYQGGAKVTHTDPITDPEMLDITVNSDCNLTCSYCTKEFSSSWRHDILKNGNYKFSSGDDPRYDLDFKDRILINISQPKLKKTKKYQLLMQEFKLLSSGAKEIDITGGEPFLDNSLLELLKFLETNNESLIRLYTGLGVSTSRFNQILNKIKGIKNLHIIISAEGIGKFLEFNRYGVKWDEFRDKIEKIKDSGISFNFQSTISNLTVFGYREFYDYFASDEKKLTFAYQPRMMFCSLLDDDSKKMLEEQFNQLPDKFRLPLLQSISSSQNNDSDRVKLREFLIQFLQRRPNINLSIYPKSFIKWLEIDHVV